MKKLKFYIKERHNPQSGVYYVPMGQLTKKAARAHEGSLYGYNVMRSYDTEPEYKDALAYLKENGKQVLV